MFFDAFTAFRSKDSQSTVPLNTNWSEISVAVPGRTPEMCEALFNFNKTFLSLPTGAVTAVAFSASMNDQYGKDPDLGSRSVSVSVSAQRAESEELFSRNGDHGREVTPPPGVFYPGTNERRASPGRAHNKVGSPGAPRVVGRRTPRGPHVKKTKDVHSPDFDVLEMAGQALVSMSPAPQSARTKLTAHERKSVSGDDARCAVAETAFGSPAPSPARAEPRASNDDISARASSRALFPTSSDEDTGKGDGEGLSGAADVIANGRMSGLDDEAFGALDGLFMLADASTKAAGARKKGKFGGKPPRAPTPRASPARVRKGDGGAAATPARARLSANSAKDALEVGLGGHANARGGRLPGQSRKSALKATQPVRLRDGVAGGGFYKSPGPEMYLHAKQGAGPPRTSAYRSGAWRYADPDTPGTAQLTKGLGLMGPRHVEEDTLETRLGSGSGKDFGAGPPGTPRAGVGLNGAPIAGTPGTPANRGISSAPSLFASTPGVLRGAPSAARRRWFLSEHFYGTIDKPWFQAKGYTPFLTHLGLNKPNGNQKFTKKEWLAIRRAMGTPKRLSLPFLRKERVDLERWRLETRETWAKNLKEGSSNANGTDGSGDATMTEGLEAKPADTPVEDEAIRAFEVGDRVAARHPRVLNVNTGSILVLRGARCLVQFDRVELGVELVMDINIAHLPHHLDALLLEEEEKEREEAAVASAKEATFLAGVVKTEEGVGDAAATAANIASASLSADEAAKSARASAVAVAAKAAAAAAARGDADAAILLDAAASRAPATAEAVAAAARTAAPACPSGTTFVPGGKSESLSVEESAASAREEDARALAEVTNALDLKERQLSELRAMNDVAESNASAKVASPGGIVLEPFQRQYANTMLKVRECNAHLQNALVKLRAQHRSHERDVGAFGAWRRFAPGGGAAANGDVGEIFTIGEDETIKGAEGGAGAKAKKGTALFAVVDHANEIIAASEYVAWCKLGDSKNGTSRADPYLVFAAKALGSLLAVKVCTDHGVSEALFDAVVKRCLSGLSPKSSQNAKAFAELKSSFDALRVLVFG